MEKLLNELVEQLKQAGGSNLRSVVLYGSAATSQYHPKHSDLNVLAVLRRLDGAALDRLTPVAQWWQKKGNPGPMLFTEEELQRSSDMFAIELVDIKTGSRLLWGEDVITRIDVPMQFHRVQVERELAQALVRLRQHYVAAGRSGRAVRQLLLASVSTFAALFRHALLALGEPLARDKRQAIDRLAALLGFDPKPLHSLLDVREGKRDGGEAGWETIFAGYLAAIERAVEGVDRRLAETARPQEA
jgi:hypothetical protein